MHTQQKTSRVFSRIPFNASATLHLKDATLKVSLIDIALKGALVHTDAAQNLQLEQPCRLLLPLAGADEAIEMTGRIAHLASGKVGLRCEHIELASLTLLRRLLELNTGATDIMDRELSQLFANDPRL